MKEKTAMWDGRFESGMAPSMKELSFSLHFDKELLTEDIDGSVAHCHGLEESGVLTTAERETICTELLQIRQDLLEGADLFSEDDEDIHMAVERILTDRIGDLGKKLHTGRSRNDQVSTDFKLYMRNRSLELMIELRQTLQVLLELATEHKEEVMPGYTHMQQAQPILFSHYLMSMFFALHRDYQRFAGFMQVHNQMPLGSGAMAGSAFPYQRELVAKKLGFPEVSLNSIDAVSHRDMALEFLSHCAIAGSTLSRYAEDMVNWSSAEFGFVTCHDAFASGSSMMPQKKNPDSMELVRGKSARLLGNFTTLFTVTKGAPLTYSRDLQEDKEPVFDSVNTLRVMLQVMRETYGSATWNFAVMKQKMLPALLATDLADLLVENGTPFRDAHHLVGALVGKAARSGCEFTELPDSDWQELPKGLELRDKLTFEFSVGRRNIEGGTGPNSLEKQLQQAEAILEKLS